MFQTWRVMTSQWRHKPASLSFEATILNPKPVVIQLTRPKSKNIWICSKKHLKQAQKSKQLSSSYKQWEKPEKTEKRQKIVKTHSWVVGCYGNVNHHRHVIDTGKFSLINFRKSHDEICENVCDNSGAHGQSPPADLAPSLRKFGNLSLREILVVMSAYVRPPVRPYRLWGRGRGRGVPIQPDWGWRMPSFISGKSRDALRQLAFFLVGNRMTTVAFEKEVFWKALIACLPKRLFDSTEVINLRKKHPISMNGKYLSKICESRSILALLHILKSSSSSSFWIATSRFLNSHHLLLE